jgi:hypothetical protein
VGKGREWEIGTVGFVLQGVTPAAAYAAEGAVLIIPPFFVSK